MLSRRQRHDRQVIMPWAGGGFPRDGPDACVAARHGTKVAELEGTLDLCNRCGGHFHTDGREAGLVREIRAFLGHPSTSIDLLGVAPETVARWVDQASAFLGTRQHIGEPTCHCHFWQALRSLLASGRLADWSNWHGHAVVNRSGTLCVTDSRTRHASCATVRRKRCTTGATSAQRFSLRGVNERHKRCAQPRRIFHTFRPGLFLYIH